MTLDDLTDMAAPARIGADRVVRSGKTITDGDYLVSVATLHRTISASAKSRGVDDPLTVSFLQLGATVPFGTRIADLTGRIAQ